MAETLAALRRKGFGRLHVDGQTVSLDDIDPAALKDRPMLQVIVDRVKVDGDLRARLTDSIETAYTEGGGAAFAIELTDPRRSGQAPRRELSTASASGSSAAAARSSTRCRSLDCSRSTTRSGRAACVTGLATSSKLDMALVVPDATKSIHQNAIEPWSKPHYRAHLAELKRAAKAVNLRLDVPWSS